MCFAFFLRTAGKKLDSIWGKEGIMKDCRGQPEQNCFYKIFTFFIRKHGFREM